MQMLNYQTKLVHFAERSGILYSFVADELNFDLATLYTLKSKNALLNNRLSDGRYPRIAFDIFESQSKKTEFSGIRKNNSQVIPNSEYRISGWCRGNFLKMISELVMI